jgi:hypothetical protein
MEHIQMHPQLFFTCVFVINKVLMVYMFQRNIVGILEVQISLAIANIVKSSNKIKKFKLEEKKKL